MGWHKNKKQVKAPPFVMLSKKTIKSPEWQGLSPVAKDLYISLRAEHNGSNNGKITLTYSVIRQESGKAYDTIRKGFRELEEKGWIERTSLRGLCKQYCYYTLTGTYDDAVKRFDKS